MNGRSIARDTALAMAVAMPGLGVFLLWAITGGAFQDGGWIKGWQTLIAGLIAIVAALIGGGFIMHQVRAAERLEEARRERRFRGARAGLSAVLSLIGDYRDGCAKELDRLYGTMKSPTLLIPRGVCEFPQPAPEVVPGLREIVELGSDHEAEVVADILSHLQIVRSRQRSLSEAVQRKSHLIVGAPDLESGVFDIAKLDAMASRLFDFARRRGECPARTVTNEEVLSALYRLDVHDDLLEAVADKYGLRA